MDGKKGSKEEVSVGVKWGDYLLSPSALWSKRERRSEGALEPEGEPPEKPLEVGGAPPENPRLPPPGGGWLGPPTFVRWMKESQKKKSRLG
jgi:hypothetical protein